MLERLWRLTNDCSLGIVAMRRAKVSTSPSICLSPCQGCRGQGGFSRQIRLSPQALRGTGHTFLGNNENFRILEFSVGGPRNLLFQQVRFLWKLTFLLGTCHWLLLYYVLIWLLSSTLHVPLSHIPMPHDYGKFVFWFTAIDTFPRIWYIIYV